MNYELRQFVVNSGSGVSTVSLSNMIYYEDSGDLVRSGIVETYSGAKYNVNGTYQALTVPGQTRAVLLFRGSSQWTTNLAADPALKTLGRSGSIVGVEYTSNGVATHTATAVCIAARPISMIDKVGAVAGRAHAMQVEMIFERTSEWS